MLMHDQKKAPVIKDRITNHFTFTPACIPEHIAPFICENKDNDVVSELHGGKGQQIGCILDHCRVFFLVFAPQDRDLSELIVADYVV